MVRTLKSWWIPLACVAFILINTLLTVHEFYWLNLLPVALLLGWAVIAATDKVLLFIVFTTPLSINLEQLNLGGIGVALPTEPLMVALMLLFILKLALERGVIEGRVWRHPVTIAILLQLTWMALCILPSSMPLVSLKFVTARLWFVCTMYFMATRLFRDPRNMHRFFWLYISGLAIVVIYTVINHAHYHFAEDPAHWVMSPFFKDHTSYGAILAFFLPFAVTAIGMRHYSRTTRAVAVFFLLLMVTGILLSYTRAAWFGVAGALGLFVVMRLRIPAWVVASVLLVGGGIYYTNKDQITIALERNHTDSSDDMASHIVSSFNIQTDASNLERINRWHSAMRMFEEKPLMGWGPGTYMFQYAPFQISRDHTIISTNFGLNGNAHSEYLGPLAEQGVLGMLLVLAVIATTCWTAIRLWSKMPPGTERRILEAAFLGLVTYYIHGTMNDFLDLDKASVPFWGFTAMIVMLDLKLRAATDQEKRQVSSAISSK
ncbi:MAG: O-antigen ligase family protein [Flavobacteriales bacterium]